MDFLTALASLAQQHPSTALILEIEWLPDLQIWEASVMLRLENEEALIAVGEGLTPREALDALHPYLIRR